jgi:hypothetical protein
VLTDGFLLNSYRALPLLAVVVTARFRKSPKSPVTSCRRVQNLMPSCLAEY